MRSWLYRAGVLAIWAGLMGYQAYQGYWTEPASPEAEEGLLEPWDQYFRILWSGRPVGFVSERLNVDETSGWVRESAAFLGEGGPGEPFVLNSFLSMESGGRLRQLDLKLRSTGGSLTVLALRDGEAVKLTVTRDGKPVLESVELPLELPGRLRPDLPLMGLERWTPQGEQSLELPMAPGIPIHSLKVSGAAGPDGGREILAVSEQGAARLQLDRSGRLLRWTGPGALVLELAERSVLGEFAQSRGKVLEAIRASRSKEKP